MAYKGKYMKYVKPFAPMSAVLMRMAFVLLCFLMLSVYLMGGLLARYSTTGSADDVASVAKFDVQVTGSGNVTVDASPAANDTYIITITNASEVAVSYTVQQPAANGGVSYTVQQPTGTLAPGASVAVEMSLTVDWDVVTRDMTNDDPTALVSFAVIVDIQQID